MATPRDYAQLFEQHHVGKLVLEDLLTRYAKGPVLEGGIDGIRKSDYRAGARAVVEFIVRRTNQATGAEPPDEE